jgi:hypothetical protein
MRGHVGEVQVDVRLVPIGSMVVCAPLASTPTPWTAALHFLGGALGNLAVIGGAVWLHLVGAIPSRIGDAPLIMAPVSILIASQLFYMLNSPVAPYFYARSPLFKRYREGTKRMPIETGSFPIVLLAYRLARADRTKDRADRRKASMAVRRELARGSLTPVEEMYVLDWLITDGLSADGPITTDPVQRPELDAWSQRALRLGPKVRTLVASRGAVLVALGRHQEGKAMLGTVAFVDGAPVLDALLSRIFLARAEHALGNVAAARTLISQARAIVRAAVQGPARAAWLSRIQHEVRRTQSRRSAARRSLGRRALKGLGRLSLPRARARLRPALRVALS